MLTWGGDGVCWWRWRFNRSTSFFIFKRCISKIKMRCNLRAILNKFPKLSHLRIYTTSFLTKSINRYKSSSKKVLQSPFENDVCWHIQKNSHNSFPIRQRNMDKGFRWCFNVDSCILISWIKNLPRLINNIWISIWSRSKSRLDSLGTNWEIYLLETTFINIERFKLCG